MTSVLLLIKGLGRGGAERIVVDAALAAGPEIRSTVAYVRVDKDALVPELRDAGVHVVRLPSGVGLVRSIRALVRHREIDVIHAHSPTLAIAARLATPKTPLVYTEHNVWGRYRVPTYLANLLTYDGNDHVFAVSDAVRASVRYPRGLGWRHMPRVETLYHGPSLESLAQASTSDDPRVAPEGARTIACVANFKVHKGHPTLIRAFAKVRANAPDAHLVLVGVGQTERAVRAQVAELGLDDAVTFAGRRDDVPAILSRADAFVLASDHEGLPLSLLEAMALGTPAVVTRVGGIPEVVRDGEAIVVPPRDVDALADGLLSVLGDVGLARSLAEAGRRRARDFDIRKAVRRMEEVYEELLA